MPLQLEWARLKLRYRLCHLPRELQHPVGVKGALNLTNIEDRDFFQSPAPFILVEVTQQDPPRHFGFGKMGLDAKPAFLIGSRSYFYNGEEIAHHAFGLCMMSPEFFASKFLSATIFQPFVRFFVGDHAV